MSFLTASTPYLSFQVTLHDAGAFLGHHTKDRESALASGLEIDIKDGAWKVCLSRPHPSDGDLKSATVQYDSADLSSIALSDQSSHDILMKKTPACVVIELVAMETSMSNWAQSLQVSVEAVLEDFRFHNHTPASTQQRMEWIFSSSNPSCPIIFPLTGLFYSERTSHKFDLNFHFTLQSVDESASLQHSFRHLASSLTIRGGGSEIVERSKSSASSVSVSTITSRQLPPLPSRFDASNTIRLPHTTLDALALTLHDGIWGDICFVLKDPSTLNGHTFVFANSKLLSKRSNYFRRLIETASKPSVHAAIRGLDPESNEFDERSQTRRSCFPHEIADSDYCADAGGKTLVVDPEVAETKGEDSFQTVASKSKAYPKFQLTAIPEDTAAHLVALDTNYAAATANAVGMVNTASTTKSNPLSRFKSRKMRIKNMFEEPLDMFGYRLEDLSGQHGSSDLSGRSSSSGPDLRNRLNHIKYLPILDAALTTFRRVIFWLETDQIVFAPFTSTGKDLALDGGNDHDVGRQKLPTGVNRVAQGYTNGGHGKNSGTGPMTITTSTTSTTTTSSTTTTTLIRDRFIERYLQTHPNYPAPASAKSIYRLAETYQLPELQDLALDFIRTQLHPSNILRELFSPFTLKNPKIREMQLEYALRHWEEIKSKYSHNLDKILQQSHFTPEAAKLLGRMLSMATMTSSMATNRSRKTGETLPK